MLTKLHMKVLKRKGIETEPCCTTKRISTNELTIIDLVLDDDDDDELFLWYGWPMKGV